MIDIINSKLKLTDQQVREIEDKLVQKYDYLYDAFDAVSRSELDATQSIELSQDVQSTMGEASKRIPISLVETGGMAEITSKKPDGIEMIKNTLTNAEGNKGGARNIITHIGAPGYRVLVKAENFKVAEKFLNNTIEKSRSNIEKQQGAFNFMRLDSKKYHTLQWVENSR